MAARRPQPSHFDGELLAEMAEREGRWRGAAPREIFGHPLPDAPGPALTRWYERLARGLEPEYPCIQAERTVRRRFDYSVDIADVELRVRAIEALPSDAFARLLLSGHDRLGQWARRWTSWTRPRIDVPSAAWARQPKERLTRFLEWLGTGTIEERWTEYFLAAESLAPAVRVLGLEGAALPLLFAPLWVRDPSSWRGGDWPSLLKHLFACEEVSEGWGALAAWVSGAPRSLEDLSPASRMARMERDVESLDDLCDDEDIWDRWKRWEPCRPSSDDLLLILICMAQGISLRWLGRRLGWTLPGSLQAELSALPGVPASLEEPRHLYRLLAVRRIGGADRLHALLPCQSQLPFVQEDPYAFLSMWSDEVRWAGRAVEKDPANVRRASRFWESVVRWLTPHAERLSRQDLEAVCGWVCQRFLLHEQAGLRFEVKGLALGPVLVAIDDLRNRRMLRQVKWDLERERSYGISRAERRRLHERRRSQRFGSAWQPVGLDWRTVEQGGSLWEFVELLDCSAIEAEGRELGNCLSEWNHGVRARSGDAAYISIRENGRRRGVIEVELPSGMVREASGRSSHPLGEAVARMYRRWQAEVLLPKILAGPIDRPVAAGFAHQGT